MTLYRVRFSVMTRVLLVVLVAAVLQTFHAVGQELVTDRPDFTESPIAVPLGMVQVEMGAHFTRQNPNTELSFPNALIRVGIFDRFECRIGLSGWTRMTAEAGTRTFVNDIALEGKYQFTPDDAPIPLAAMVVSTLPTGEAEVSSGSTDIGLKLASGYDLDDIFGLSANAGIFRTSVDDERRYVGLASLSLGMGFSGRLGGFVEVYVEMPEKEPWQPVLDGGLTFLLHPSLQLDLYVGKGLNDQTPDFIFGGGVSFRVQL